MKNHLRVAALLVATALLLSACASDPLADAYKESNQNYVSGDGSVTEYAIADRGDPVDFKATTDRGDVVSSDDYRGDVLVVNFWYAGCPPCRVEAPDLEKLSALYKDQGATFLGVNVRDQAPQSVQFAKKWGISYPSVIDVDKGTMLLAFAGTVAPNAVPTTLVIDKQGRVAARFLGLIDSPSILKTLIRDAIAEAN
ncbi:MAG: TlpA family protein disulfide reductase [Microbacteriaceae bacterium]